MGLLRELVRRGRSFVAGEGLDGSGGRGGCRSDRGGVTVRPRWGRRGGESENLGGSDEKAGGAGKAVEGISGVSGEVDGSRGLKTGDRGLGATGFACTISQSGSFGSGASARFERRVLGGSWISKSERESETEGLVVDRYELSESNRACADAGAKLDGLCGSCDGGALYVFPGWPRLLSGVSGGSLARAVELFEGRLGVPTTGKSVNVGDFAGIGEVAARRRGIGSR